MGKVQSKYSPIVDHASKKYYNGGSQEELNKKLYQDENAFELSLKDLHKDYYSDKPYEEFRSTYITRYGDPFLKKKELSTSVGQQSVPVVQKLPESSPQQGQPGAPLIESFSQYTAPVPKTPGTNQYESYTQSQDNLNPPVKTPGTNSYDAYLQNKPSMPQDIVGQFSEKIAEETAPIGEFVKNPVQFDYTAMEERNQPPPELTGNLYQNMKAEGNPITPEGQPRPFMPEEIRQQNLSKLTWIDKANNFAGSFNRYILADAVPDVLETIDTFHNKYAAQSGFKPGEFEIPLDKWAESYRTSVGDWGFKNGIFNDPATADQIYSQLGSGMGQAFTVLLTKKVPVTPFTTQFNSSYKDSKENLLGQGLTEEQASEEAFNHAFRTTAVSAPLEILPYTRLFNKIDKYTGGTIKNNMVHVVRNGAENFITEGTTETLQQLYSNIDYKLAIDANKEITDGLVESFIIGGATGGMFATIVTAATMRRDNASTPEEKQAWQEVIDNTVVKQQEAVVAKEKVDYTKEAVSADIATDVSSSIIDQKDTPWTKEDVDKLDEFNEAVKEDSPQIAEVMDRQTQGMTNKIDSLLNEKDTVYDDASTPEEISAAQQKEAEIDEEIDQTIKGRQKVRKEIIKREVTGKAAKKPKKNDTENIPGIPSEVGVGQESIQVEPVERTGQEEVATGGMVSEPSIIQEEVVQAEPVQEVTAEEPVVMEDKAPVAEAAPVSKEETVVAKDLSPSESPEVSDQYAHLPKEMFEKTRSQSRVEFIEKNQKDFSSKDEAGDFWVEYRHKDISRKPHGAKSKGIGVVNQAGYKILDNLFEKAKGWLKDVRDRKSVLPKSIINESFRSSGRINEYARKGRVISNRFQKAIEKNYSKDDYADALEQTRLMLSDKQENWGYYDLPPAVKEVAMEMRQHIKNVQAKIVASGAINGPLAEKMGAENEYTTRAYRKFTDSDWASKVSPEVRNRAEFAIRDLYANEKSRRHQVLDDWYARQLDRLPKTESKTDKTREERIQDIRDKYNKGVKKLDEYVKDADQIDAIIESILYNPKGAGTPMSSGKLGGIPNKAMAKRKDIPEAIRDLMGEIKDPVEVFSRTVFKLAKILEGYKMQEQIAVQGLQEGWLKKEAKGKYHVPLSNVTVGDQALNAAKTAAREKNPEMSESEVQVMAEEIVAATNPLSGLYANEATAEAIKQFHDFMESDPANLIGRLYNYIHGAIKLGKVALDIPATSRNAISGVFQMLGQGYIDPTKGWDAFKHGFVDTFKKMADSDKLAEYTQEGIINESLANDYLRDMSGKIANEMDHFYGFEDLTAKINKAPQGFVKGAAKLGNAVDNGYKVFGYEQEKSRYKWANPDWTEDQLRSNASRIVRMTQTHYAGIPKAVKLAQRIIVSSSFAAWNYENVRNNVNTLKLIIEELSSSNPKVRWIGAQRSVGYMTALAAGSVLAALGRNALGWDDEREEAMKSFDGSWSKNSVMYRVADEDGSISSLDLGQIIPQTQFIKPINAIMNGLNDKNMDVDQIATSAVLEMIKPFFGGQIPMNLINDINANEKGMGGGKIYQEHDPLEKKTMDVLDYLYPYVRPGYQKSYDELRKSIDNYTDVYGREYTMPLWVATQFGLKPSKVNIATSLGYSMYGYKDEIAASNKDYFTKYKRDFNDMIQEDNPEDRKKLINNILKGRQYYLDRDVAILRDLNKKYWDSQLLGVSPEEAKGVVNGAKFNKAQQTMITMTPDEFESTIPKYQDYLYSQEIENTKDFHKKAIKKFGESEWLKIMEQLYPNAK